MMAEFSFRSYSKTDKEKCLAIFDANCPEYFSPNERVEYHGFLDRLPEGYEVSEMSGHVVAAFGLINQGKDSCLKWILLDPQSQGLGLGSAIMKRVVSQAVASQSAQIGIAASHNSAPFFARFGAVFMAHTEHGWGPGMHRVDMEIFL